MSFVTAIASLRTAIEATGLTDTGGDSDSTLLNSSRANFDGAYLIRVETGAGLYRELKLDPEAFSVTISLEIGTTHKTSETFATSQARAALRSQLAVEALISANHNDVINITRTGTATVQIVDRKQVTTQQFVLIYRE